MRRRDASSFHGDGQLQAGMDASGVAPPDGAGCRQGRWPRRHRPSAGPRWGAEERSATSAELGELGAGAVLLAAAAAGGCPCGSAWSWSPASPPTPARVLPALPARVSRARHPQQLRWLRALRWGRRQPEPGGCGFRDRAGGRGQRCAQSRASGCPRLWLCAAARAPPPARISASQLFAQRTRGCCHDPHQRLLHLL